MTPELLSAPLDLTPIDGGYRVTETETHYLDVLRQIYSWRLVTTPKDFPMVWDRGWCYYGTGLGSLAAAVLAARTWDGSDDSEPEGWNKNIQTQEWRPPED